MIFKVEGSKKAIIESTNKAIVYYNAPSESDVRKHLLKQPIDNGGFKRLLVCLQSPVLLVRTARSRLPTRGTL